MEDWRLHDVFDRGENNHMKKYTSYSFDTQDRVWPLLYQGGQWKIGLRRLFNPLTDHKDNVFFWYNDALRTIEMRNLFNISYKGFSGAQHSLMVG